MAASRAGKMPKNQDSNDDDTTGKAGRLRQENAANGEEDDIARSQEQIRAHPTHHLAHMGVQSRNKHTRQQGSDGGKRKRTFLTTSDGVTMVIASVNPVSSYAL
eukprot:3757157-Rhodomonas_salina.1